MAHLNTYAKDVDTIGWVFAMRIFAAKHRCGIPFLYDSKHAVCFVEELPVETHRLATISSYRISGVSPSVPAICLVLRPIPGAEQVGITVDDLDGGFGYRVAWVGMDG